MNETFVTDRALNPISFMRPPDTKTLSASSFTALWGIMTMGQQERTQTFFTMDTDCECRNYQMRAIINLPALAVT